MSPTYEGACADVSSVARACREAGVPLVVDEAHGAHLAFLAPSSSEAGQDEQTTGSGSTPRGERVNAVVFSADAAINVLPRVASAYALVLLLLIGLSLHMNDGWPDLGVASFGSCALRLRFVSRFLRL